MVKNERKPIFNHRLLTRIYQIPSSNIFYCHTREKTFSIKFLFSCWSNFCVYERARLLKGVLWADRKLRLQCFNQTIGSTHNYESLTSVHQSISLWRNLRTPPRTQWIILSSILALPNLFCCYFFLMIFSLNFNFIFRPTQPSPIVMISVVTIYVWHASISSVCYDDSETIVTTPSPKPSRKPSSTTPSMKSITHRSSNIYDSDKDIVRSPRE